MDQHLNAATQNIKEESENKIKNILSMQQFHPSSKENKIEIQELKRTVFKNKNILISDVYLSFIEAINNNSGYQIVNSLLQKKSTI